MATQAFNALTGVSVGSNANLVIDANSNATLANVSGNYYTGNGATFAGNVYTSLINTGLISGALGAGYVASVGTHSATVAYASQYIFGTSDFTIEFWFNPTTLTPGSFLVTGPAIQTNYETDGTIALYISSNGGAWNISEGTLNCTTTVGVWSHIALVRNGTSFKLYKDGVLTSSVTSALGIYNPASTITLVNGVDGRLSNYRIVIGTAVYTAPFTPPNSPLTSTQTANQNGNPSNAITGTQTKLLTFESSSVIDISSYSASITNTSINMVYQDVPFGQPQGTFIYDGNTWQASPINVNGNVSATQFIGGGNLLSNVLTVSQYTTGNFSNIINNVHGLNFDTTTGFSVTDLGGGNALVSLGSSFKTWEVDGQANLVAVGEDVVKFVAGDGMIITTNANAYPQQIEFTANFGGLSTSSISNGNSNVNIATANGNITISSEGNANVVVVSGTGAKVSGSLTVGAGTGGNVTGANVVSANTVTANLVYGNYLQGDGYLISNITVSAGSSITNGTSNVLVNPSGNVNTSAAGVPNVFVVTSTGANVLGTFDATGNISANFFTGNGVNVTGNLTSYNANLGNLVAANYFSGDGGLLSNIGNANYANFAGTAYSVDGANVSGEVANANYSTYGNYADYSNLASYANTFASNNLTYYGVTNDAVTGQMMWAKYGNGNTIFDASNSTSPTGSSINNGNADIAWNNNYPTLMGWNGANTYGVRVDSARIADLANLSTYANIVTDHAQPNITSLGNLTNLVVEGNISSVNIISANTVNANIANANTINANLVAGNYVSGDGYLLSNLSISGGSTILNGNSNVVVAANSNVSTSVAGNANVVVVTGTGMNVVGTFNTSGNVNVGNLQIGTAVGGTITGANAIVANFFVGNGALLTGISTSPNSIFNGNSNVNIATANGNVTVSVNNVANVFVVSATGVTANYYSGNGGGLSNIAAANIVGNVANANYANIAGTAYSVAGANVSGNVATANYATYAGTAYSVDGANVSGDVANANYANYAGTAYSVDGANVSGDVATANYANYAGTAFAIDGANVSNTVANANFALYSNLASFANIVTDAAQPNITSLGNLTQLTVTGNTLIAGNLTVDGNITYVNVDQLYITDPIIEMGGSANGDPLTTNDGKDRGTLLYYYNGAPIEAFMGWDNSNSEFILGSNVTNSSDVITVNTYGNVRANVFIGNLSGNANNSNYLNGITSNGLFNNMGLDLTTYNNFNTPNNFGYQYIFGNTNGPNTGGTQFYTVASGIGGDYPYSDYAQQMAINRFTAGGDPYLTVRQKEAGTWGDWTKLYAGYADSANTANYSANAGYANTANLANYATNAGYADSANLSTYSTNSNYANIIVDNAQPNITSVGTLIDLNVSGNIIAANFTANTGFFTGDGGGLSNINGANIVGNISGNIANANYAEYSNLASFSNTFASNITNYFGATNDAVAGQLMWTKYGNGHTVFDASNSTSPTGTLVDSANATIPWTANYPTLMGWNGSDTYGVRVDSARLSDSATSVNGANITGDVANATYANFAGSAYSVDGANVSGEVANANYATYGNYSEYSNNANYSGTFASNLTNYFTITNNAVAGQLMWSLYGNDHVLFDASNGTSPAGTSINNGDATVIWTNNYPTIMGWNGSDTYGVRVDSSRVADIANSIVAANVVGLGNVALANFDGSSSNVLYGNGVFAPAANLSSISNGTSNVVIDLDGNVSTSVSGNANIFVVTGTGANIDGYANVTGNINGSNLSSDGNLYLPNTPTGIVSGTLGQTWTANFDGAGSFVTAPSGITSGSWTIEFWVNPSTVSGNHTMLSTTGLGYPQGLHFWIQNGLLMLDDSITGEPTFSSIAADTWTHFALVRDSVTGITTVYQDGVVVQDTYTGLGTPGTGFIIGNQTSVNWYFAGAMSNFRVVDGIQVYTAAFTPPTLLLEATQTANVNGNPSAAITGTETVLLTFENSTFVDNSSFNNTITPIGTMTTVNQSVPFAGSLQGTLLFNGTQWEISPALNVNGTITAPTVVGTYFIGDGSNISNIAGANIIGEVSNANYASFSNIANVAFSVDLANVVGIGNIASINIDGSSSNVLYGNGVFAPGGGGGSGSSIANGTSNVNIDTVDGNVTTSVSGNANVVIVTGTGINVAGTINTSGNANVGNLNIGTGVGGSLTGANSITANYFIGNGSLLTGISVSSIFNGTSNVIVSANGNVSTSVAGNANVFVVTSNGANVNGNVNFNYVDTGLVGLANVFGQPTYYGDFTAAPPYGGAYLTVDNNASLFDQNGAFTIECFFYPRDTTGLNLPEYIWNFAFTDGWFCAWNLSGAGHFDVGIQQYGGRIHSSDTFTDINQWYHIALSSDGTTTRLFVNGILQGTYAGTGGTIPNPQTLTIAAAGNGPFDYAVNGKISNFRFVKDVAVYTENFVVPGGPLPENQLANINGYPSAAISAGQTSLLTLQDSAINDNSTYALTVTNSGVTTASIDKIWSEGSFTYNGISWYTAQNITANFFIGDGSNISNIAVANVVGIGNVALANFDGNSSNILYGNGVFASGGNSTAIVNGTSNVIVELNGNVTTSVNGNANVFVVTGTGANLNGDLTVVSNVTAANFNGSGAGTPTITSATNLDLSAPVSVRVVGGGTLRLPNLTDADIANLIGANGDIIYNTTVNTVQAYENGGWANINSGGGGNGTAIVNGNSNVIVSANGNVSTSVAGNANVFVVTDTGANVNGTLTSTGNVYVAGLNTGIVAGFSGEAYMASFNGTNQCLIADAGVTTAAANITIECWIKPTTSSIIGLFDSSPGVALGIRQYVANKVGLGGDLGLVSFTVTAGVWQHFATTVDSTGEIKVYIDGVLNGSINTVPVTGVGNFGIGSINTGEPGTFFDGLISNFRVTNKIVYSTSFSPPTQALGVTQSANQNGFPSAAITGTEVTLLTFQNSTIIDNSTFSHTFTNYGSVTTSQQAVPFNGNDSILYTGSQWQVNGNLTVTNISNLGNVGNVKITGGANGQILQTDGTGNLNWYNKPSGGTGFIYVYTRTSGAVEVQLVNSTLKIIGRSGNILVPIS